MTPDPTIRAALEAACHALCEQDGTTWEREAEDHTSLSGAAGQEYYMAHAQTAIAAFLRALPQASVMIAATVDGRNQWHTTRTLAAAVEEAGR